MAQPLITQFYNKRKRPAEGITTNLKSKVLVLDGENESFRSADLSCEIGFECLNGTKKVACNVSEKHVKVVVCNPPESCKIQAQAGSTQSPSLGTLKVGKKLVSKSSRNKVSQKSTADIRLAFQPKGLNRSDSVKTSEISEGKSDCIKEEVSADSASNSEKRIVFELLGGLSPKKRDSKDKTTPIKKNVVDQSSVVLKSARRELGLMTPKKINEEKTKAGSLDNIRNKLNKSSRLAEIRESIKKFKKSDQELNELESKRKKLEHTSPCLRKFTTIDLEVPVSPQKATSASPLKESPLKKSPGKSPLTSPVKAPAFQRLSHLVQTGVPSLPLPYGYRVLEEIFRCMDTVTSMMYNRKETVTFDKLKSGVQQMLRRTFSEHHIGQIKMVFPNAFALSQEKCSIIMSSKKINKYQLVVVPLLDPKVSDVMRITNGSSHSVMTPTLLVQRREQFHKNLLEIVKDHHKEFLENLNPPVIIPRSNIKRWHPDFQLDKVPAIMPAELPSAPEDKTCTAKDVLDQAKTLFGCNERMEKALKMVCEQMKTSEKTSSSEVQNNTSSSDSPLLRGIPKALLEKVRAKQAAKALLAMTRTPAEDREAVQLLRLPEIARILCNIFVAEKKSVLPLEVTLQKLTSSYREALSNGELEQHIRLLMKIVPGWVDIMHIRKTDYVKVSKDADMSAVMRKLEKVAAEKNSNI